jgi:hypothetical protein
MMLKMLLGRNSELSVENKIILYKQFIRSVWSYDIQLWDCASDSTVSKLNANIMSTHDGTFEIVTILITGSRRLQIS